MSGDGQQTTEDGPRSSVPRQLSATNANDAIDAKNLTHAINPKSEISDPQSPIANPKPVLSKAEGSKIENSGVPSGSLLHAPNSLLPPTWLPLSLAPSLSKTDLLKFAAYAALFFLVCLYPFEKL